MRCRSARTHRRSGRAARVGSDRRLRPRARSASRLDKVARARWSALLTDATLVSSSSATSLACHRNTSRRMSTARWRAGRCWSAVTNARRMDSLDAASSAGSPSSGTTRASGMGVTHADSGLVVWRNESAVDDGPRSMARARRCRLRSMSRHTFVAMRYSHDRTDERPSKLAAFRQARTSVSCTASSASNTDPSIR